MISDGLWQSGCFFASIRWLFPKLLRFKQIDKLAESLKYWILQPINVCHNWIGTLKYVSNTVIVNGNTVLIKHLKTCTITGRIDVTQFIVHSKLIQKDRVIQSLIFMCNFYKFERWTTWGIFFKKIETSHFSKMRI